jgi:hypothetical protein
MRPWKSSRLDFYSASHPLSSEATRYQQRITGPVSFRVCIQNHRHKSSNREIISAGRDLHLPEKITAG